MGAGRNTSEEKMDYNAIVHSINLQYEIIEYFECLSPL